MESYGKKSKKNIHPLVPESVKNLVLCMGEYQPVTDWHIVSSPRKQKFIQHRRRHLNFAHLFKNVGAQAPHPVMLIEGDVQIIHVIQNSTHFSCQGNRFSHI